MGGPRLCTLLILATTAWARALAPRAPCQGYQAANVLLSDSYLVADLALIGNCSQYSPDITNLRLLVEYQTDSDYNVYQVQDQVLPRPNSQNATTTNAKIQFAFTKNPFSFNVTRTSTGEVLFDTSAAPLIFESQFVSLRTRLPQNPNLYGLGEHSDSFRLQTNNYIRTLWDAESPFIPNQQNLYGSHPVYLDHRGASGTHGVFLLSSSGMDIEIGQTASGDQFLEYRTIGGVLDFYFLAGPDPAAVSKQYAEVVGLPAMVSYWTLGFHQCKYGWPNIDYVAQVVANYSAANIPLETVWGDIDYMDNKRDFTTSPVNFPLAKVRQLVSSLHENNQHYVVILDPGIKNDASYSTYARGAPQSVFLKAADGSYYRGSQWAGEVVWPDWFAPKTQDWWSNEIKIFADPGTGVNVDGLWTDMNEVSNFCNNVACTNSQAAVVGRTPPRRRPRRAGDGPGPMKGLPGRSLFQPAYRINNHQGDIAAKTLDTNVTNADGTVQYDTHNLYGTMMAGATRQALIARTPGKRPFVLTRSTFAGAGRVAAHWFGDNFSSWDHYRTTIRQLLAFATIHAMPMVGSDVCGFNGAAQENMCARWAALGAFQPFYRNHADISAPDQEFYRWASVADSARKAIAARYRLLDYLYTAMHRATSIGDPVASPLWFPYPADTNTFGIQTQWFLGDALLISPVVDDDSTSVTFYLPNDIFYDFWTHAPVRGAGAAVTVNDVAWSDIPVHIRGGSIVPLRVNSANTTTQLRQQNFTVIVAPGLDGTAKGYLYLDDGESLDVGSQSSDIVFTWDGQKFQADGTFGYATRVIIESVVVLGGNGSAEAESRAQTHHGPWALSEAFGFRA
ncbi:glycosyl hydrolases family 31-domain-containing protein [Lasiosphaeria miniovina]|uniref:alpha-glucosidase n=1 Tax=Lasiosphaeria miniovina TaxID=1954250 RepID=A0AA40ACK3_9PEZI|nr:glycosyl hydrolases family 31-domain-containing protein [Lasiosphaeria miniovina]KAK0713384.1 glycosyl hydrolases family 31-domain-containing protein [Lasiosphaeria miniovina]